MTMFAGVDLPGAAGRTSSIAENHADLVGFTGDQQPTVIAQIAATVFGGNTTLLFYFVQFVTALILVLAANTAFNGFPVLGSILAQDRYLPRQLHTRGDRLVFSNGIVLPGRVRRLADLGLRRQRRRSSSSSTSSASSSRSPAARPAWSGTGTGCCAPQTDSAERRTMHRRRLINAFGVPA